MTNKERIEYLRAKAGVLDSEVRKRTELYGHPRPIDEAFIEIAQLCYMLSDFIEDHDRDH